MEEGAGREPVGGGDGVIALYTYIYIGGRGRAGAGRRGKTVLLLYDIYTYTHKHIYEEGAGQEPVGGGRRCYCVIYLYRRRKGLGGSRQEGEDGEFSHFPCELHIHMNNV